MDHQEKRLLLLSALDELDGEISFALLMEHEGKAEIHLRDHQPCYGELRKYEKTHPGECTGDQGKVVRPPDLEHPFPKGRPIGLVINFGPWVQNCLRVKGISYEKSFAYFSYFFSPKFSPFSKGLGQDVEIIHEDQKVSGVVFYDMCLDPTILVDLLLLTKNFGEDLTLDRFANYREAGMTFEEAALACYTIYQDCTKPNVYQYGNIMAQDAYVASPKINVGRFLRGGPQDLTGGMFEDRFDYNRPKIHDIFNPRKGDEIGVAERISKKYGKKPKIEDVVSEIRLIVNEARG